MTVTYQFALPEFIVIDNNRAGMFLASDEDLASIAL